MIFILAGTISLYTESGVNFFMFAMPLLNFKWTIGSLLRNFVTEKDMSKLEIVLLTAATILQWSCGIVVFNQEHETKFLG